MFLQDIVISPDIFEKISKAFSDNSNEELDFKSYVENLQLKRLVLDYDEDEKTSLFMNTIRGLSSISSDLGKKRLELILNIFLISGKLKYINISSFQIILANKEYNCILNLGMLSDSKIINSENEQLKSYLLSLKELSDIEILSFEDTIKPIKNSFIFCYEKKLQFEKGKIFNFEKYFIPYLNGTKCLIIEDRYIRKKEGGYINLLRIVSICPYLKELVIKTITREGNIKDNFNITVKDLKSSIIKLFPQINIKIIKTIEHSRKMISDDFVFEIDPGFDFVDKDYISRNRTTIHISKLTNTC